MPDKPAVSKSASLSCVKFNFLVTYPIINTRPTPRDAAGVGLKNPAYIPPSTIIKTEATGRMPIVARIRSSLSVFRVLGAASG